MGHLPVWELPLIGLLMVGIIFWFRPGLKRAFEQSRQATSQDWKGLLLPLGAVVLFVILVILMARHGR